MTVRILTAHQPVYLPWLGLLHKLALSDVYVFLDTVKYLKQDCNNRNLIKTPQGPLYLTVPVATRGGNNFILSEVRIANDHDWAHKHWSSICNFYAKAPYFRDHKDFFDGIYRGRKWDRLVDLNEEILRYMLQAFNITVEFVKASEQALSGESNGLLINMCRQLSADVYIFGALGRNYADVAKFNEQAIQAYFQEFDHPVYTQLYGPFVSHLSAIDLLFNHGPSARDILMVGQDTLASGTVPE